MAVNLSTVSKWKKEFNVHGEWLHYDEATEGKVNRIRCLLCSKHEDRLQAIRNHQKLQHRVRAWHYRKRAKKRRRAFEIGQAHEGRFSCATADENDKRNLEEHAHRESVASASSDEKDGVSRLEGGGYANDEKLLINIETNFS